MREDLLHTPDGVRDIYNEECQEKLAISDKLHQVQKKYGYRDIETPTFEFFDIFGRETGTTPSKDLYKFFDKEGNTLVLRPDFTPSIARSVVKYYTEEDMPVRLCYMGNTFINHSDYRGRLKEVTQCGAEMMGDDSVAADAEMLAMTAESLKSCGLREFQIAVGHAQFFSGILEAAGIAKEKELLLRDLISNKNFFGVEEFLETLDLTDDLRALFQMLSSFDFHMEDLQAAMAHAKHYPKIAGAVGNLIALYEFLKFYGIEKYVSFELGMITEYKYYTGIIFAGYTFGTGEPIVRGGRYDKLLGYYGKEIPAIGFAIVVDQLLAALNRQNIRIDIPNHSALIVFSEKRSEEAIRKALLLRVQGMAVETILMDGRRTKEDYFLYARKNNISRVDYMDGE